MINKRLLDLWEIELVVSRGSIRLREYPYWIPREYYKREFNYYNTKREFSLPKICAVF